MEKDAGAAKLTLDKLGGSFEYSLYRLTENLKDVEEVTGPLMSMFLFDENCYVVDVRGPNHRYLLLWTGWRLGGQ